MPYQIFTYVMRFRLSVLILLFLVKAVSGTASFIQEEDKKRIIAVRASQPPEIDGVLDDEAWRDVPVADNFIIYSPDNGKPSNFETQVKIVYDDIALYVGAFMYDPFPDSIFVELGERDGDRMINADNFSIELCPYNDGINGFRFKVTASGVQSDSRIEQFEFGMPGGGRRGGGGGMMMAGGGGFGSQDNWDAVWESDVKINEKGWVAEFKIPYSALRFPKEEIQTWGINFWREVRRIKEQSSWNYVNRDIGSSINHLGELCEICEVKPPLRLSVTPYISGYVDKYTGNDATFSYNGGLDIKLGITESFTVDATLIPDFGQVQADDQILNLTPFEVMYSEKRPFFMEGTELFDKGRIFYSRRIGSTPKLFYNVYDTLEANEIIVENPPEAGMINATKLSGRTHFGLGIGVLNAMTAEMNAVIEDTITGSSRTVKTQPFTNYNILVLDQNLGNSSYVSLINTNVRRRGPKDENFYTSNVTATDFMIRTKNNLYSISVAIALSQKYYDSRDTEFGHSYDLRMGKTGGAFRIEYTLSGVSDTYDPNDMGYIRRNNEFSNELQFSYNINRPVWRINSSRNSFQVDYSQLYSPRVFTRTRISLSSFTIFRNHSNVNLRFQYSPKGMDDYFEPRVEGWFYHSGKEIQTSFSYDTNRDKKFFIGTNFSLTKIWSEYDQRNYMLSLNPGIRLNNRLSINHMFSYQSQLNDFGYVNNYESGEIFFGKRNNKTYMNTLSAGYIFSSEAYLSLRLRHYWSRADYTNDYFLLTENGELDPDTPYTGIHDSNFNSFNVDLVYNWRFAPGSDISIVWKNAIYSYGDMIFNNFTDNIDYMFNSPQSNSISVKILYYLDYQYLKRRK
jgi:hypothetical protein